MQKDFGDKLREARTQQGISIRQVADAIKIRSDFLESFENDHGNFDMPDVYKRGFIKLYARYLKLDVDEILEDFLAYHHGSAESAQLTTALNTNEPQKVLAQISLQDEEEEQQAQAQAQASAGQADFNFNAQQQAPQEAQSAPRRASPTRSGADADQKNLYLKVGLTFAGALCVLSLVAVMIGKMISSPSSPSDEAFNQMAAAAYDTELDEGSEAFTLASDSEVHVIVRQEKDKQHIFTGNISKDKPVMLERSGPVKIHFSNGSQLVINKADGKKVRPSRDGVGWIEI